MDKVTGALRQVYANARFPWLGRDCCKAVSDAIEGFKGAPLVAPPADPAVVERMQSDWAAIRPLLTGLISDVECAVHYNEGTIALSAEAPDEARAGIERMDALLAALTPAPPAKEAEGGA